jgi:hypothetical protein
MVQWSVSIHELGIYIIISADLELIKGLITPTAVFLQIAHSLVPLLEPGLEVREDRFPLKNTEWNQHHGDSDSQGDPGWVVDLFFLLLCFIEDEGLEFELALGGVWGGSAGCGWLSEQVNVVCAFELCYFSRIQNEALVWLKLDASHWVVVEDTFDHFAGLLVHPVAWVVGWEEVDLPANGHIPHLDHNLFRHHLGPVTWLIAL